MAGGEILPRIIPAADTGAGLSATRPMARASPPGSPRADWTCKFCARKDGKPFRNHGFREACLLCGKDKGTCLLAAVAKSPKPRQRASSEGSSQRRRTKRHPAQEAVQAVVAQLLRTEEGREISTLLAELEALRTATGVEEVVAEKSRRLDTRLAPRQQGTSAWGCHPPGGSPQRRAGSAGGNSSATAVQLQAEVEDLQR